MDSVVTVEWLQANLSNPDVRVVDASWHMPSDQRNPSEEYLHEHIPNSVFFDLDGCSAKESPYSHMLPSAIQFAETMASLGVSNHHHVVVYDTQGLFSAARLWWMLRVFGHEKVSVLNGGLLKWKADGAPVAAEPVEITRGNYQAHKHMELVRDMAQVRTEVAEQANACEMIIDARGAERFSGRAADPRAGVASGHIPGSVNIAYKSVLMPPHNTLKPTAALRMTFKKVIETDKPVIATCGSGVTACILMLALDQIGQNAVSVYDGSWSEWGAQADNPISSEA